MFIRENASLVSERVAIDLSNLSQKMAVKRCLSLHSPTVCGQDIAPNRAENPSHLAAT